MMKILSTRVAVMALATALPGCFSHHVDIEPIEMKPIHVTVDINVKVQRELDDFFDFEGGAGSQPASRSGKRAAAESDSRPQEKEERS